MEKHELNRDQLLQEILRETAPGKKPKSAVPDSAASSPKAEPSASRQQKPPQEAPVSQKRPQERRLQSQEPERKSELERKSEPERKPEPERQPEPIPVGAGRIQSEQFSAAAVAESSAAEETPAITEEFFSGMEGSFVSDLDGDSQPAFSESRSSAAIAQPRKKHKSHRVISALIMTILIIVISVTLSGLIIIYGRDLLGINSDSTTKIVTIPAGATMDEIAEVLEENGIISKPKFFVMIAGMSDKDTAIKPGDHELRPDMAYETILSELVSDPLDSELSVSVTFQEGIRLVDAADLLEENNVCDSDEFLDYFNNDAKFGLAYEEYLPSFQDEKFYQMEGYLFPDTYTFYQEMDVSLVCQKILENFNSKITSEYYDRMEALNLSLDDTITLASMIQAEAGSTEQMANISSVFWNRLNNSTEYPLLQSDPTTKYVEEVIKPHSETYDQNLYDSYDTYTCTGLPAGPICNPGSDAIQAALYPANTEYYYFYSNIDTKQTYFSKTLEEHNAVQTQVAEEQASADAETVESEDENGDGDE